MIRKVVLLVVLLGSLASAHSQQFKLLYSFGGSGQPANPGVAGTISQTPGGNMISSANGIYSSTKSAAYEMTVNGKVTVLQNFDGAVSYSGLVLATDQRFHGTIANGGKYGHGAVFRISPTPFATVIYEHDFMGGADGSYPTAPPIQSTAGDFYGTTSGDYTYNEAANNGTIYKITKAGVYSVLHTFSGMDGASPVGPLVQSTWGSFYGVTQSGGKYGQGTVFRINSDGSFKLLYEFDTTHGSQPDGPLIEGSDGNLYGTTPNGGSQYSGVAFKITPGGTLTVLHSFNGGDGAFAYGGLVEATDGNFYGALYSGGQGDWGTLYRLTPDGLFTKLHDFTGSDGIEPMGTLLQHTNGKLYGQAYLGGANNAGTLFEYDLGLSPFVTFLNVDGVVGAKVVILGQSFADTSSVYFNGVRSVSPEIHPTYIKAVVPEGASTGYITVTTPLAILKSNKPFIVH